MVGSDDGDPDVRPVTIYDVAEAAGVAASTVSRALSKPGRVSFRTAEHVRTVAARLGYRTEETERDARTDTSLIAMVVADITNPVFYGMIRGAERAARHAGCTMVLAESQESAAAEHEALQRIVPAVDAVVLTSSRMSDAAIRTLAKSTRVVVLNRLVDQVPSVATDTIGAVRIAAEHLLDRGHSTLTYLAGPAASWSDGMRWRGVLEAGQQLALKVRRIGPFRPTIAGGREAAAEWLGSPSSAVIAYNDLLAIGFQQAVSEAGLAGARRRQRDRLRQHPRRGADRPRSDHHRLTAGQPRLGGGPAPVAATTRRARRPRPAAAAESAGRPRLDRPGALTHPTDGNPVGRSGNSRQPLGGPRRPPPR